VHAIEKGQSCRQATKRRLLSALMVPWDLRHEYFPEPRRVRGPARVATPTRGREAQSA
jgi:hypothetical protein